jgi:hypothetical protein
MRKSTPWLILMALVVVLFYWKTLLTHQFSLIPGSEGVNQSFAWLHFWLDSLWHGRLALWDPYEFAGSPFAATMLPSAFYPLQLIFAAVPLTRDAIVSPQLFHEYLALAHILAAYFGFALLRELGRSYFAAFVGGCVFALSGLLVRMIWPPYIHSCIWLPAIFLFLLRAIRARTRNRALLEAAFCGVCMAISIFTGGMAFFIMQAICVVGAIAWYAATERNWVEATSILAVALLTAVGLSAVQLIPASEYGKLSLRFIDGGPFPAAEKIPFDRMVPGVWPQSIVSALFPSAFDGRFGGEEYFPFYVGVFPLVLAVIAIWKCRDSIWVRYFAALALFAFLYAMGEFSPLYGVLYAITPLLWVTRAPSRFFYLISFALAMLSAFGLDALLDRAGQRAGRDDTWDRAKPFVRWISICATAALLVPALFNHFVLNTWNAFSLLLILGSCAWFVRLSGNTTGKWLRGMLAAFILFDLAAFNWIEMNKNALAKAGDQMDQMISLRGPAEFIKHQPGLHRVRVGVEPQPNIGDIYRVESIWGGGATVLTTYSQLGLHDDLMNVEYLIKPAAAPDPNPVYQDARWKVYRSPNAFPRAWIVHKATLASSQEDAFRQLDRHDLHQVALTETPLALAQGNASVESVRLRSWAPESFAFDATASSDALLVLSEMYYPGWVATVNGKPARVLRVDGALRGVALSSGPNQIVMKYQPTSFRLGGLITLATLACFLAGWRHVRNHS